MTGNPNGVPIEWGVEIGYDDFITQASTELKTISSEVLTGISPETIQASLHHPNGFLVHTMESTPEGQLRLHIWPAGRVDDLTPHSHPWHMVGRVLLGTYREYIPKVRLDDSSDYELMVSDFNEARQQVGIRSSGRTVSFELGELNTYPAGEHHILPAGAFHVTQLPKVEPFITLVRTGLQFYEDPSFVKRVVNQELQLSVASERKPPTEDEVQTIWEQLVPLLEEQ